MKRAQKLIFVALVAWMAAALPLSVGATTQNTYGDLTLNEWNRYYNQRQINYAPYGIAFNKHDGPHMYMRWFGCGGWAGLGPRIGIPNADPSGWIQIGPGALTNYQIFCIDVMGGGDYNSDSFIGQIDWDGYDL